MLINGFRLSFNRSHAFRSVNEGLGNKNGQRGNQEDHRDTRERSANAVKAFPWLQQPTWKQSEQWWLSSSHTHTHTHTHTHCPVCGCVTFGPSWEKSLGNNSVPHSPLFNASSSLCCSLCHSHTHTHTQGVSGQGQRVTSLHSGVTLGFNHTYLLFHPLTIYHGTTDSLKNMREYLEMAAT